MTCDEGYKLKFMNVMRNARLDTWRILVNNCNLHARLPTPCVTCITGQLNRTGGARNVQTLLLHLFPASQPGWGPHLLCWCGNGSRNMQDILVSHVQPRRSKLLQISSSKLSSKQLHDMLTCTICKIKQAEIEWTALCVKDIRNLVDLTPTPEHVLLECCAADIVANLQ